ncbi:hypothetical protein LJC07_03295 [Christensenellaceae bacterium OttesenSCG-928-L17]|nr:hypothetical protein [Christensenellaceae bacterium OttesenSCG-928-L17]
MKQTNMQMNEDFERIEFFVPKGAREVIEAQAERRCGDLNTYLNILIERDLAREDTDHKEYDYLIKGDK